MPDWLYEGPKMHGGRAAGKRGNRNSGKLGREEDEKQARRELIPVKRELETSNHVVFTYDCTFWMSGLSMLALCDALEINLTKHHDALYDAIAYAEAYIRLKSGISPNHGLIKSRPLQNMFTGHERITGDLLKPNLETADPFNPFYSKKVVFTGVLDGISRDEAAKMVKAEGADIDTGITRHTHYVIAGSGAGPAKLKKVEEFNAGGAEIRVSNKTQFLDMIKKFE